MNDEKKKILITEDERSYANALSLKLKNAGYEVLIAENGVKATEILKEERFDLIFLDLIMPEMNGFGVLEFIKEQGIETTVIVFSTLSQDVDIDRAFEMGATDFINKSDIAISDVLLVAKKYLN